MTRILIILLSLFFCYGCIKNETIVNENHTNEVIEGNVAPPYTGVTTIQIKNYINKLYTDLYGREPLASELDAGVTELQSNELTLDKIETYINSIIDTEEYHERFFEIYRKEYLRDWTVTKMENLIVTWTNKMNTAIQNNDPVEEARFEMLIEQANKVLEIPTKYRNKEITINEMMYRISNNAFFDAVNVGVTNFVLACFENLHKRLPTDAELDASVNMNNGIPSIVLFQDGTSKADFLSIITESAGFYEGLITDIYKQSLGRLPDSDELGIGVIDFAQGKTFQEIQMEVLTKDEYKGF